MLSPNTSQTESSPLNFSPIMNACVKPSGDGCSAYSNLIQNWLPSPKRRLKPGKSKGVEIMSISRIPANTIPFILFKLSLFQTNITQQDRLC